MDFSLSQDDCRFRDEVREFLRAELPAELRERHRQGFHIRDDDHRRWTQILGRKGWVAPEWPREHGSLGLTPIQRYLFDEEFGAADAPTILSFGRNLAGPLIYTFGTPEQRARFLPPILAGAEFWCQGFSEPNAGSDLASLQTRAEPHGDAYVLNGGKIWTTEAHHADFMFCLARTSAEEKRQNGLSFLLVDMKSPGITVRPIWSIDGEHHLNEVFFDDVVVPADRRVGEEGQAWSYAKFVLTNERTSAAGLDRMKAGLRRARRLLVRLAPGLDPTAVTQFRRRLAQLEVDNIALERAVLRVLTADAREMAGASALKLRGSALAQRVAELVVDLLGPEALPQFSDEGYPHNADHNYGFADPDAPGAMTTHLYRRALTIAGGAYEVQRGIVAKQMFGL